MKVYALLSWFDESPEHLSRCVRSLQGFADVLVAVDGAYATFPGAQPLSPHSNSEAILSNCWDVDIRAVLREPTRPWHSEIAKRAAMFAYARQAGATPEDWYLVIDADMTLAQHTPDALERLAATDMAVAEVNWHDMQVNEIASSTYAFRSMFRALPGLTVERTHYLYTVPCEMCTHADSRWATVHCAFCEGSARRFLWHAPSGQISQEPALDLTDTLTLHHYNAQRQPERKRRALKYYQDRDAATLESAGDWHTHGR